MSKDLKALANDIVKACKLLYEQGLIGLYDGNISVKLNDLIIITPSGIPKPMLNINDLVIVDENGQVISGKFKPSVEVRMHLGIYKAINKCRAVVHTHNPTVILLSKL